MKQNFPSKFIKIYRYLLVFDKNILCFLLFLMIFLSFGQVVSRNIFSKGFMWIDGVLRIGVLWLAFIGASLATHYKQHIKIDILANFIKSDAKIRIIDTIAMLFAMSACIIFFFSSINFMILSVDTTSSMINGVPDWVFEIIIPYCFFTMTIRCAYNIYITNTAKTK